MNELIALLDQALLSATFRTSEGTDYSAEELRQALTQARGSVSETRKLTNAHPQVDDAQVGYVVDYIRDRLSDYIDAVADRIGHSFHVAGDITRRTTYTAELGEENNCNSSLQDFAMALIHAAAVLESARAAKLIELWAGGEPWEYKILVVLAGVSINDSIELDQGLGMYRLPTSSDSLPVSIPDTHMRRDAVARMLGHTLLEIDAATHPAFFTPLEGVEVEPSLRTCTVLGECSPDTFFLALSLVCGQRVELAWTWRDFGDAGFFTRGMHSGLGGAGAGLEKLAGSWSQSSTGVVKLGTLAAPAANLCEQGLRRAWELRSELQSRLDSDQRFRIAVTRWAKAATPRVMNPDRIIDLRIALEALYLDSSGGELGFRLSLTGARHLRTNLDDRQAVRRSLVEFYGFASRVIHGAPIGRSTDVTLVDMATDLCREGILKIVEQRKQPRWTDLLLS